MRPLFAGPAVTSLDDCIGGSAAIWSANNLLELGKDLGRHGVQFYLVANEQLSAEVVTQYLDVRRRQLVLSQICCPAFSLSASLKP